MLGVSARAAVLTLVCVVATGVAHAEAQTPVPMPPGPGVISGMVRNGTGGAPVPAIAVQLIAVPAVGPIGAQQQTTVNGAFRFEAPADPTVSYLIRTEYGGVPYLDRAPILISRELPTAERDVMVWETT